VFERHRRIVDLRAAAGFVAADHAQLMAFAAASAELQSARAERPARLLRSAHLRR